MGHSFGEKTLMASKTSQIEESLWVALRMLEERRNLQNMMAEKDKMNGGKNWKQLKTRADESIIHINRIREILLNSTIVYNENDLPVNPSEDARMSG